MTPAVAALVAKAEAFISASADAAEDGICPERGGQLPCPYCRAAVALQLAIINVRDEQS